MMAKIKLWLTLILLLQCFTFIESMETRKNKINEKENFMGAVYEHLPISALPVCYEKGNFNKSNHALL